MKTTRLPVLLALGIALVGCGPTGASNTGGSNTSESSSVASSRNSDPTPTSMSNSSSTTTAAASTDADVSGITFDNRKPPATVGDFKLLSNAQMIEVLKSSSIDDPICSGLGDVRFSVWNLDGGTNGPAVMTVQQGAIKKNQPLMQISGDEHGFGTATMDFIWYAKNWAAWSTDRTAPLGCVMVQMERYAGSTDWPSKLGFVSTPRADGWKTYSSSLGQEDGAHVGRDDKLYSALPVAHKDGDTVVVDATHAEAQQILDAVVAAK